MRSTKLLSYDYWVDMCQDIYGVTVLSERSKAEFSFNGVMPTNTIFTNGGDDPWQWATQLSMDNTDSTNQVSMADCTNCGHCGDLYTPKDVEPAELTAQRVQVLNFIESFLTDHKSATPLFLQN